MIAFAEQGSSWDSAFNQRELHRQGDVALFLPFACNNGQQAEAKIDTLRKLKSTDLYWVKWAIRQPRATSRKRRLPLLFPPVNRRVVRSRIIVNTSPATSFTPGGCLG